MSPILRISIGCIAVATFLTASRCSRTPTIASGEIVYVELGKMPVPQDGENWKYNVFLEGKIEICPTCIILTEPDGKKHFAPPDRFGRIEFK